MHLQYICFSSGSDIFVWLDEFLHLTKPPFSSPQPSFPFLPCSTHTPFHHVCSLFIITLFSEASAMAHSFPIRVVLLCPAQCLMVSLSPLPSLEPVLLHDAVSFCLFFSGIIYRNSQSSYAQILTVSPPHVLSLSLSLPLGNGLLPLC